MKAAEKGDDDRRKSIARRNDRGQLSDRSRDFKYAGQTRESAADQKRHCDDARSAKASEARRAWSRSLHTELKPEDRMRQKEPGNKNNDQRQRETEMYACAFEEHRRGPAFGKHRRLRKAVARRIAPRSGDEIDQNQLRDISQHKTGQDLARIKANF